MTQFAFFRIRVNRKGDYTLSQSKPPPQKHPSLQTSRHLPSTLPPSTQVHTARRVSIPLISGCAALPAHLREIPLTTPSFYGCYRYLSSSLLQVLPDMPLLTLLFLLILCEVHPHSIYLLETASGNHCLRHRFY